MRLPAVRSSLVPVGNVVYSDLLEEKGRALKEELGSNVAFYRADATSPADTEALIAFAVERCGRFECVVNNAAAGRRAHRRAFHGTI